MILGLVIRALGSTSSPIKVSLSQLSLLIPSDKAPVELSRESLVEEPSSASKVAGRLPVKAEKSISRLNYTR